MYAICNIQLFKVSHEIGWKTTLRLGSLRNEAAPTGCWGRAAMGIGLLSESLFCRVQAALASRLSMSRIIATSMSVSLVWTFRS
jgi:hypothetical protein